MDKDRQELGRKGRDTHMQASRRLLPVAHAVVVRVYGRYALGIGVVSERREFVCLYFIEVGVGNYAADSCVLNMHARADWAPPARKCAE